MDKTRTASVRMSHGRIHHRLCVRVAFLLPLDLLDTYASGKIVTDMFLLATLGTSRYQLQNSHDVADHEQLLFTRSDDRLSASAFDRSSGAINSFFLF